MLIVKVQLVDIKTVIPYARNPRKNQEAVSKVAASIKEFGFKQPIVVDAENVVIAGHTRLMAAQQLEIKKVPVVVADDLTEAQVKAYRIADNRVSQEAEWDYDLLKLEIDDLVGLNFNLDETGFDLKELEMILADKSEGLTDPDEIPEAVDSITKLGDVWLLGNHRLVCGDSTSSDDIHKLMQGVYPDLIHTDPPYGMNAVSKSGVLSKTYKQDMIGDDSNKTAKESFILINNLYPLAKQIWWGANYYSSVLPDSECWLVWDKLNGESDQTDCELAWANFRSVVRQFTHSSGKKNRVHPTQKPVALMGWIIKRFKINSKVIADYFGGSGSTLMAAEMNNITSYIMEYDPKYCDIIVKRWENFTGKTAQLETSKAA